MNDDPRAALVSQIDTVRQYAGTDAFMQFEKMLDLMREVYRSDLEEVTPDRLQIKQGANKQVRLLLAALRPGGRDIPIV